MKPTNWKDIAELIGISAIVASLIFVGLQMKQAQEIAIADQYQNRAGTIVEFYMAQIQSERVINQRARQFKAAADAGQLTAPLKRLLDNLGAEEYAVAYMRIRAGLTTLDNYQFQHEKGFMDDSSWNAFRNSYKSMVTSEMVIALVRSQPDRYRPSFLDVVDSMIEEADVEITVDD